LSQSLKMPQVFVVYVLMVVLVSLLPSGGISLWHIDKVGHYLAYAGMALLAFLTFKSRVGRVGALIFAVGLGAVLEWAQSFVPGRDMSVVDGIANTLGVITGAVCFCLWGEQIAGRVGQLTGRLGIQT
jgi:VanZ family protein